MQDPYSTFTGIAVDPINNEVVLSDDNRFNLLVYDRAAKSEGVTRPRRKIGGPNTHIEFIAGVDLDPRRREIYTVNNDVVDQMVVISGDQNGDVTPVRILDVDHGAWGISLDLKNDEFAVSSQHSNRVALYRRTAQGRDKPVRLIQGPNTGLVDPHGVFIDGKNDEIFVVNQISSHKVRHGTRHRAFDPEVERQVSGRPLRPSTGRFVLPSITVYSRTADGDVTPLRTIQGHKTGLELPLGITVSTERNEIYVANGGGHSILVFDRTAEGDVAPIRRLEGPATGLRNPADVSIDAGNSELWVSNWGNHSATVYPLTARGNVQPLRVIRSAPAEAPLPGIGNPGAVAYDTKRGQLLVPN